MHALAELQDVADALEPVDWAATELGPVSDWDLRLRTLAGLVLRQSAPACLFWGARGTMIFNGAWKEALGPLQAAAFGRSVDTASEGVAHVYRTALSGGTDETCLAFADALMPMMWRLLVDAGSARLSCIPVPGADGAAMGLLVQHSIERRGATEPATGVPDRVGFLLRLSDALRRLNDPERIQTVGTHMLDEVLRADWATFTEIDPEEAGRAKAPPDGRAVSPTPAVLASHDLGDAGSAWRMLGEGMPLAVRDVRDPSGVPLGALGDVVADPDLASFRARLTVPVLRSDRLASVMTVCFEDPHDWSVDEIAIAHEAAVRIWESVERARAESSLRLNEARHRALFESIDEGVCLYERLPLRPDGLRDYRYINMNPAMQEMFGIPDLSGQSIRDNFPDEIEAWYDDYDRVLDTGEPIRVVRESDPQGMVLEMFVTRVEDQSRKVLLAVMQEVTARVRAEAVLRAEEARKAFLLRLSDAIRPLRDPREVMHVATQLTGAHFGTANAEFAMIEHQDGEDWYVVEGSYAAPGHASVDGRYRVADFPGVTDTLLGGESLVVHEVAADPFLTEDEKASYKTIGVASFAQVPLVADGRLVALLTAHDPEPRDWTDDEVALLEDIAGRTWGAVERARAEDALRESERRLRKVLDGMGEAFGIIDRDFRIITQNKAALDLDGRSLDEIRGRTHWEVYPGTEHSEVGALYRRVLAEQVPVTLEHHYTYPTGGTSWLEMRAFPVPEGLAVFWRDITPRKKAEEALRQSERRLRMAQKAAGVATFDWEIGSHAVRWSPEALSMMGLRPGALGGTYEDWIAMIHPDDLSRATQEIEWALEDGELEGEWRIVRPDGSTISALVRGTVERDDQGRAVRLTGAQLDVTDMRLSEELTRLRIDHLSDLIDEFRRRLDKGSA
ncbi:PAS domain S-box protein [Jannaschia seohaensis]|uniref:histidine kinase n=1 Tax=Jannaschia seohaensis TaxID=475081 RepID=A0A2Y9AJI0_9RHOB|nr:PAS domain S-box protein [Jannaschia seohaensis]PWJ20565.1 PAS domain S-box-containing protein [Jannaschia seohaensis]SSA44661.1 PAS domain S-box-containing protein [Jannaschia seohaensis]